MTISKEIKGNSVVLTIVGHLDAASAPELEKVVNEEVPNTKKIVFDFKGVEYISSAGLRVLLQTHKLMSAQGGEFIIENIIDDVKSILEMTGFLGFLNVK